MKKIFFLMSIAVLALTSCVKDSVKEANNGRAIDFRVSANTKATELTTGNLHNFYVTAIDKDNVNYFTDAAYTLVDSYFHSSPSYYWPGDGSSLNFYAYAPAATELNATASITAAGQKLLGYSPAYNVQDQKDFITTTATGSKADATTGVELQFNHQLTQIEVRAKNANSGYVYTINNIKLVNIASEGDFDFTSETWTLNTENEEVIKGDYVAHLNREVTLGTFAKSVMIEENDNFMLIPQQLTAWDPANAATSTGAYIAVMAKIYTKDGAKVFPNTQNGNTFDWLVIPVDTKWEAGYKYVYTLDFSNGAGYTLNGEPVLGGNLKFTMETLPWDEKATVEATVNKLIGSWEIKRIEAITRYPNGDVDRTCWDTKEDVESHTDRRFHKITVYDEENYVVFPGDPERQEILPYYLRNNELEVPEMRDENGNYVSKMFIREASDNFLTFSDNYEFPNYTYERITYYARIDDIEIDLSINHAPQN